MKIKGLNKLFKRKPTRHYEVGGYEFDFYLKEEDERKSYLEISTGSGIFTLRLDARTYPFGYLWVAAEKGLTEQLHGYALLVSNTALRLCESQGLVDVLTCELNKYVDEGLATAAEKAAAVTEESELASQAFMEEVVKASAMTEEERASDRAETREIVEEMMREESVAEKPKRAKKPRTKAKKRYPKKQ